MKVNQRDLKTMDGEQEVMNFTSIEQANNWLDEYDGKGKNGYHEENFNRFDKGDATTAPRRDRIKYIEHAIMLLDPIKYERERILLTLRTRGYPIERIAQAIGTTIADVKQMEELALNRVKDEIAHTKATKIPIVGGMR